MAERDPGHQQQSAAPVRQLCEEGIQDRHRGGRIKSALHHVHVADTQWYLSGTPELMREAMRRLEHSQPQSAPHRIAFLLSVWSIRDTGPLSQIQRVLAIPTKRFTRTLVQFLTRAEVDALLAAPDLRKIRLLCAGALPIQS